MITNSFHKFVSWNAKGSQTPVELTGQAHSLGTKPFGEELYDTVSLGSALSTVRTNAQKPELAADGPKIEKLLTELKPRDSRATAAAKQILNHVQGALGGIPAAFGMAETDVHGEQPFFVRIHKAKENGGPYQEMDPKGVDAIVYVDPKSAAIVVDTEPGDRWAANLGPFDGAALR
jgi:hypothetical protein